LNTEYEDLYRERKERLSRAYNMKEPDRVPLHGTYGYFAALYGGITIQEFLTDYEKLRAAVVKTSVDFGFDTGGGGGGIYALPLVIAMMREYGGIVPGMLNIPLHKTLDVTYCRFPGVELSRDTPPQFIGQEYMKPDEYDDFIDDTFNFIAEKLLPRHFRNVNPTNPSRTTAAWIRYGEESQRYRSGMDGLAQVLRSYGFPDFGGGFSYAPLDFIGDYVRDIKNVLIDTYRVPDKVKQAAEAVKDVLLELAEITARTATEGSHMFIPLHLNEYFSPKQYNEYYWPTLVEVVKKLVKLGFVPYIYYEGYQDAHLESILDLPKGKTIARFEKTDLAKAKEVIGGHACIIGGPPSSLFLSGTPAKVDEYVKSLLPQVKEGGGFVLVKALKTAVQKYGVY
jgi:hypothetical protein